MNRFIYKAKRSPYETVDGLVAADTRAAAIEKLSASGLYILSVEEEARGILFDRRGFSFGRKISVKEITTFTRQLSDLLASGLTIVRALGILTDQAQNGTFKEIVLDVKNSCIDGNPLSVCLARHPRVFPSLYRSLIRSGELSGSLDEVLERLADFNDRQLEMRTKITSALAYPALMAFVGLVTITVLLAFVIPRIAVMFSDMGQKLPLPTLILMRLSAAIRAYWWALAVLAAAAWLGLKKVCTTDAARARIDAFMLRMPVLGDLVMKLEIARFSRTLGTLLKNGVPALESLAIVAETVNNSVIKNGILSASESVREGASMADGFSSCSAIPPVVVNMMAVGEEGGRLDDALFKVAESYERETDAAIKVMMSLLEPVMILVLGIVVGFIVISMLLPIFSINFLAG